MFWDKVLIAKIISSITSWISPSSYLIPLETDPKPAGDREREPDWKWEPLRHLHCSGGAGCKIEIFLGKSVKFRTVKKNS